MRKYKYTEEDYKKKCEELGLEYIGNHKDKHKGTMIDFICHRHLAKGIQSVDWSHYKNAKIGCPYCYERKRSTEEFIKLINNDNIEILSEYLGCEQSVLCKCKVCGTQWSTIARVLSSNGSGCPRCGKEKAVKSRTKTYQQFVNELKIINPFVEVVDDKYINTHTKIKCKCKIDGTEWYAYPANLLNNSAGCPQCNMSNPEREMLSILNKLHINYVSQYSIDDCRYKYKLKFDAYDVDNNIAFEYNGEQHYKPVDFANKGQKWAEEQFNINIIRDNIKIEYCKNNNIPLIIIPYWECNNMECFIIEKLKTIGVNQN